MADHESGETKSEGLDSKVTTPTGESAPVEGESRGSSAEEKSKQSTAERSGRFAAAVNRVRGRVSTDTAELDKLREEVNHLRNQLRLAVADKSNLERVLRKEMEEARVFSISGFARDLIVSCDNLEVSLDNLNAEDDVHAGVKMTWEGMMGVLERHGVQRIYPLGQKFDPKFHEAVSQVVDSDKPSETVLEVLKAGYIIQGKLLRPASVVISSQATKQ